MHFQANCQHFFKDIAMCCKYIVLLSLCLQPLLFHKEFISLLNWHLTLVVEGVQVATGCTDPTDLAPLPLICTALLTQLWYYQPGTLPLNFHCKCAKMAFQYCALIMLHPLALVETWLKNPVSVYTMIKVPPYRHCTKIGTFWTGTNVGYLTSEK